MIQRVLIVLVPFLMSLMVAAPVTAQQPATRHVVWPPPPDVPRIRYVGSLSTEKDIGRGESFFGKLKRTLAGQSAPRRIGIERPFDVLVEDGERIYVTNGLINAVVVFDKSEKKARYLGEDVPGGLLKPMGLGGDGRGNVYVADPGIGRIVVFDSEGRFIRAFGTAETLRNPVDVAVDAAAGRLYVVDSYLHQVVVFDLDGTVVALIGKQGGEKQVNGGDLDTGQAAFDTMIAIQHGRENQSDPSDVWENRGAEPGEFRYPVSADVGPDGTLYVSDQMNFRVQAFDREGRFLRQFGGLGKMPGSFARPKGVAVDANGHIYVVDAAFNNVQVFNRDGSLLIVFGSLGHGEGEHWLPLGISVDESNRIYVADRFNNRTQVYEYLEPPSEDGESGSNATGS